MKQWISLLLLCFCLHAAAQDCAGDSTLKKIKESSEVKAGIGGYPFIRTLRVSRSVLAKDFSIVTEDSSYRIAGFYLTYITEGAHLCLVIEGNRIRTDALDFLKELKENEFLGFEALVAEKEGRKYKLPSFMVIVTE